MAGARSSWQATFTAALQDSRISMILTDDTEECKVGLRGMARQCDWVVHLRRGDVRPFLENLAETMQQVHAGFIYMHVCYSSDSMVYNSAPNAL